MTEGKDYCVRKLSLLKSNHDELSEVFSFTHTSKKQKKQNDTTQIYKLVDTTLPIYEDNSF